MNRIAYMNHYITKTINGTWRKRVTWILFGAFLTIIMAFAIAEAKWHYLLIVSAPFFIYIAIKSPFILPFGLYVLLIPFDPILAVLGFAKGATLTKFIGILAILVLTLKGFIENKFIRPGSVAIIFMLFIAYCFLTFLWAIDSGHVFSQMPTLIGLFVFYLITSLYKIKEQEYKALTWCVLFGGILAAVLTFYMFNTGLGFAHTQRATITLMHESLNPNALAISLLIPVSVCTQMMFIKPVKKIHRVFFLCLFLLMVYVIILTGSRKSLIGVGIILAFFYTHIKNKLTFATIALIGAMVLLALTPDYFIERIGSSIEDGGAGRLVIWHVGVKALREYWLLGAGFGNFPLAFNQFINEVPSFAGFSRGAHNIYLMILIETGVVGLFLFFWTLKKHYELLKVHSMRQDLNLVMLKASFWSILIAGFFADILLDKACWLLFMMIVMYRNVLMNNPHFLIFEKDIR